MYIIYILTSTAMLGIDSRFSLYRHNVCPRTTAHTGFHDRSPAFCKHSNINTILYNIIQ